MSRFVRPETRVLTLANGDTLVVKARLTNGEQRAQYARMYLAGVTPMRMNPLQTGLALVTAYLLDWSIKGLDGNQVVIRDKSIEDLEQILDQLSPQDFEEIKDAIEAHERAMTAERGDQKKILTGEPASSATSSSPPASAGGTSGSGT